MATVKQMATGTLAVDEDELEETVRDRQFRAATYISSLLHPVSTASSNGSLIFLLVPKTASTNVT